MTDTQGKRLILMHTFQAPRATVWKLWTLADQMAKWWCPNGFTIPMCEADVRPGGQLQLNMQSPDGTLYPMKGEYREVIEPERLVFVTSPLDAAGKPLFETLNIAVFTEAGGVTTLQLDIEVLSATPEAAPYLGGMKVGWQQSLAKQNKLLEGVEK